MPARSARLALAAGLVLLPGGALPGSDGLGAQEDTAAIQELAPAVEEALPAGDLQPTGDLQPAGTLQTTGQPQPAGTLQTTGVPGPPVLEVSPEVLESLTEESAPAPETAPTPQPAASDTARYITSRVGAEAVRERAVQGQRVDRQSFVLPYRVLATGGESTPDAAPSGESGESRSYLRPVIQVGGQGLSFAGSAEGYRGRIYLGVQDSLQPTRSQELPEPIHFLLDVSGGSAEPRDVAVEHTNLPYRKVTVATREIRDSVRLRVRSSVHGEPLPLTLPVSHPSLSVSASPPSVPGLGLETTTLTVSADRLPAADVAVTVESTMGRPRPSEVRLGEDGSARVSLRSTGLGATEVRVRSPGYRAASTRVRFGFPLAFLAAALLGGIAGGTARHFRTRDGEDAEPWLREAGVAVVFGLIVAVAYAVGVNVLGVEIGARYGEALVFTLAALGGYFRIPTGGPAAAPG